MNQRATKQASSKNPLSAILSRCLSCDFQSNCISRVIPRQLFNGVSSEWIHTKKFKIGQHILKKGDPLKHLIIVQQGSLKTEYFLSNGQYSVISFPTANYILGFDGFANSVHHFDVIGLSDGIICTIDYDHLWALRAKEPEVAVLMEKMMSNSLLRIQHHLFSMANHTSVQKLAYFLSDLCERQNFVTKTINSLELPMGRDDLNSYLGITTESLSRAFTSLENKKIFKVNKRLISEIDTKKLREVWNTN
jgi:CRP/FNR family transcriptional regulator